MKLREGGMPGEPSWETLPDVELILDRLGVDKTLRNVVELGCGYGTFTLPVARRIDGLLATVDIDRAMVERTRRRAREAGLTNIVCAQRDVTADGFGRVLVIHWRYDPATPRGPALDIRPRPEQIPDWASQSGLLEAAGPAVDLPPWHYGLCLEQIHRPC